MTEETVIEEVTVTAGDKTAVFEIVYSATEKRQRAYVKGSTKYYDMDVFNKGLKKADKIQRNQIADLFSSPPSAVDTTFLHSAWV